MLKAIKISLLLLLITCKCYAQTAVVSIPANADIMAHKTDTIAIFGDVQNYGRFGSMRGAVVMFFGQKWKNDEAALLTDEHYYNDTAAGYGGIFRFMPASSGQSVYGGYNAGTRNGSSFPNVSINNPNGLFLDDLSDLKVRNNLYFENGHLYLNGWNLVVGNGSPGIISGYSAQRFIVTGPDVGGGFLYREHVTPQDKQIVFPIGTNANSYSPLALQNLEFTSEDFHVRVLDNVYRNATSGSLLTGNNVLKTWNVASNASVGSSKIFVWLQHEAKDEGPAFSILRDFSYVSLYRNNGGGWDTIPPGTVENPGKLTTSAFSFNSYTNTRTFPGGLGNNVYFSKASIYIPRAIISYGFNASRLTIRMVETNWAASREVNIMQYELQRRRENEDSFYTVKIIPAKTPRGVVNTSVQYYTVPDDNLYDNWTYYRLKVLGLDGLLTYSEIKKVPWFYEIKVSPNPNRGVFVVSLFGLPKPVRMEMYDIAGRLMGVRELTGTSTQITLNKVASGNYVLVFYDTEDKGKLLDRKQIIILK